MTDKLRSDRRGTGRWGRLQTFQAPFDLVDDTGLVLKPRALSVLLTLLRFANIRARKTSEAREIIVRINMRSIGVHVGLGRTQVWNGLDEAIDKGFIAKQNTLKKYRKFGSNEYTICDHGTPLSTECGGTLYYSNHVQYMTVPVAFVAERHPWALCNLSSSEIALYTSVLWLSSKRRQNEFSVEKGELQRISRLSRPTFAATLESPTLTHLFSIEGDGELSIAMLDPYTGARTHPVTNDRNDAANYVILDDHGIGRRLSLSYSAEQTEALLMSCNLQYRPQGENFVMTCIFHDETQASLHVHTSGYFKCFGCDIGKGKHMVDLVMRALAVDGERAIKHIAKVTGIAPERLQFREFKSKAEQVYQYTNERGELIKEKLRFAGKKFQWRTYVKRSKPLLYNAHLVRFARTVAVTEGEKDADNITNRRLKDEWGDEIVGTTSGSATSWKDGHANALRDKRTIILPDSDQPGQQYADAIAESLTKRGIEFRTVSFAPDGVNDVSDFLEWHSPEELITKIGPDWFYAKCEPAHIEA